MRYKLLLFVLFFAFMLGNQSAWAQQAGPMPKRARTAADYQPRTLKDVTTIDTVEGNCQKRSTDLVLNGKILPSRVKATYLGLVQPMPEARKRLLSNWAQRYAGAPTTYTQPYQTEVLFKEDGTEYWLAVRERSVTRIQQELKAGDEVNLYLIRVGGVRGDGRGEWVLLAEEFQKQ